MNRRILTLLVAVFFLAGCANKDQIAKVLKDNPDLVFDAIKDHPMEYVKALQSVQRALTARTSTEGDFQNPKNPKLASNTTFRGPASAPVTIVAYSDFECGYCSKGADIVEEVLKKYKDKVRYTVKHLPLPFHKSAKIAAQYFEAIQLQDTKKAWDFYKKLYANQGKLKEGEAYLKSLASGLKVDMAKLAKDVNSAQVLTKIDNDTAEAREFGIQGTPAYIINGVSIRGYAPIEEFSRIIDKHLGKS